MAQVQHFDVKHTFNPANVAFSNKEGVLAQEAFPGELAALRAELAQLSQLSKVKQNQQKSTIPLVSAKALPVNKATNQAVNKATNQAVNKATNQATNQAVNKATNQAASQAQPEPQLKSQLKPQLQLPLQPKQASQLSQSSQAQMADQLIEMMPTGLVMLDGDGVVVKINKVARSLLDEPILGQLWFNVIARSFKPRADDWHEVSLKDGRRVKLEIASLGAQPGQLIMITDLTETRLLQDKVGQMQRLSSLGKMVSTLAHQIRTPLSAAMLYSANLSNRKLPDNARATFQEKLTARLHDLEQQVNDMLLFSKSGNEQVVAPLSVNELINDSVQAMDALIIKAKAQVNVHLNSDDCQVLANKNALAGAMQNLIHNALQAAESVKLTPAIVNIQVYVEQSSVYISVQDNGPGIDLAIIDKIFEPFYTSSSKGTGLGLAVVKSVLEAHQGEVNYLSQAGQGAHFCLQLPLLAKNKLGGTK